MDSWPFSDKLSSTHETSPARVSSAKRKAGMSQLYSDSDSENEAADQSWLNVLPNHAIFQLQDDMRAEGHAYLPASPDLSAIGRDDASSEVSQVLSHTHLHVSSNSSPSCRQSIMAIVRDTELVVAVGQELRIASLAEVKAKASTASGSSSSPGTYKVLNTALSINFDIVALVPSPTNPKLLAVVGRSEVVVVVLPRKEWNALLSNKIECRTASVGQYHHGPRSSAIASVKWHPLGHQGATLCVLTQDAVLREYDLNADVSDPVNTLDFAQPTLSQPSYQQSRSFAAAPQASFARAGVEEEDNLEATGLCFGSGKADWGPLTVYCLMRDGTLFAACPYLPQTSSLSNQYMEALFRFVTFKHENVSESDMGSPSSYESTLSNSTHADRNRARGGSQLKFVNALIRHSRLAASSEAPNARTSAETASEHGKVSMNKDMARWNKPRRQGPFLLQPAPLELEGEVESNACDIVYVSAALGEAESEESEMGIFLMSYSDGKIDVCLEVEKIEGRWVTQNEEDLPMLLVYESIDLGISAALRKSSSDLSSLATNHPILVHDPIYHSALYVYHSFGVHSLSLTSWLHPLLSALRAGQAEPLGDTASLRTATEVSWLLKTLPLTSTTPAIPINALAVLKDVYLGYTLLALSSSLQLVAIELALVPPSRHHSTEASAHTLPLPASGGLKQQLPTYIPIISRPVFEPSTRLDMSGRTATPRFVLPIKHAQQALEINPDTLRFLGQTVASMRTSIRDLVTAGNSVQNRFELQCKELGKQLQKFEELRSSVKSAVTDGGHAELNKRLAATESAQQSLLARADRVLQRLMDGHEPVLSTYETDWFADLDRLQADMGSSQSGKGLQDRVSRLKRQVELLGDGAGQEQGKITDGDARKIGRAQVSMIEGMLSTEAQAMTSARTKIAAINGRLEQSA